MAEARAKFSLRNHYGKSLVDREQGQKEGNERGSSRKEWERQSILRGVLGRRSFRAPAFELFELPVSPRKAPKTAQEGP